MSPGLHGGCSGTARWDREVGGDPLTSVELSPSPSLPHATGGRVLQLPAVQEEDKGRYTCEATNAAGRDHRHYELEVLSEYRAGGGRW